MPEANELKALLVSVEGDKWLRVNVYPHLIEEIAGRSMTPGALVQALGHAAQEAMRSATVQHTQTLALLITPFFDAWEKYATRLTPDGPERTETLRFIRQIRAEAGWR